MLGSPSEPLVLSDETDATDLQACIASSQCPIRSIELNTELSSFKEHNVIYMKLSFST